MQAFQVSANIQYTVVYIVLLNYYGEQLHLIGHRILLYYSVMVQLFCYSDV